MDLDQLYLKTQAADGNPYADEWQKAARSDVRNLANWIQRVPIEPNCSLFEIYEAVSKSDPPPSQFFVDELKRLIAHATRDPNRREIYAQLEAFALLDRHPAGALQAEILKILQQTLQSPLPQVRRFAAHLAGDFLQPPVTALHRDLRCLAQADSDWRVRYLSFCALRDLHHDRPGVERPPSLGFLDRLRVLLLGKLRALDFAA